MENDIDGAAGPSTAGARAASRDADRGMGLGLPASLLLSAFVTAILLFFNCYSATDWMGRVAGILVTAFEGTLSFLIFRSPKPAKWRALLFISFALLMVPAFIAGNIEARGSMQLSEKEVFLNRTPFCHIVIPQVILPYLATGNLIFPARLTDYFASVYSMLVIWLVASLILGRGWCSWVCFYGGWDEGASRLAKKARLKIAPSNDKYRYFSFAMLMLIVLGSLASLVPIYCDWLCPFKMVTEYADVTSFASTLAFILMVITFFGLTLLLPFLTKKRFQCTAVCPFGAFQSLAGKLSPYRVTIDAEKCVSCGACVKVCPTSSIRPQEIEGKTGKTGLTCTLCGQCIQSCPKKAIKYSFAWEKRCGVREGIFRRLSRASQKKAEAVRKRIASLPWRFLSGAAGTVDELLSPRALFTASALMFGGTIAGGFGVGSVQRLIHLFATGSFLLK